jgi:poly(A) polymerase
MYYDPESQIVVDFHQGIRDAKKKTLRMIGDAATRYREDPVRIIRIVRFAAKLGFDIEPATERPIAATAPLLANVPLSRLFDEMVKLLQTGHALASIEQLKKHRLIGGSGGVFPVLDAALSLDAPNPPRQKFVRLALEDTDRRVDEGRAVVPSFMLACLLWHDVLERWSALKSGGDAPFPALQMAVDAVFDARIGDISGRGKLAADMREVWLMQPRFERRTPSSALSLVNQPRFRAGYDFLRLRADCGEVPTELADWWEDFHLGDDDEREALLQDLRATTPPKVRRVPAAEAGAPRAPAAPATKADALPQEGDAAAPRKRRRRRRKPAGEGGGGSGGGESRPATAE